MAELTKQGKRLLSMLLAAAVALSGACAALYGLTARAAEPHSIPYHDFSGMEGLNPVFLGNSNEKKDRWCAGGSGDTTLTLADESYLDGGKSAKLTNPAAHGQNAIFVDLYGDNALAPGDYTAYTYIKLENVVTDSPNANDQGFRLCVHNWKTDDTTVQWDTQGFDYRGTGYSGTSGWQKVKLDFSVPEGVKTSRLSGNFSNCSGTAYVTNFLITARGAAEPDDPPAPKDPIPYHDFSGMEGLDPVFLGNSNEKKDRWCAGTSGDTTLELANESYQEGGKSAKLTNPAAHGQNGVFVDLYGSNALAPGDYTAYTYIKLENVVTDTPNANDQGFRLCVHNWKTDDTGIHWDTQGFDYRGTGYSGTSGWQKVKLDFSVPEGVKTSRLNGNFSNCSGTAYVTNFLITARGAPEPDDPPAPVVKDPIPYHDFTGMEGLDPIFLENSTEKKERWCAWGNDASIGTAELSDVANVAGGKSTKLTNTASCTNTLFVDLYDSNALAPGDYTLSVFLKLEDIVTDDPGATDQGFRLEAVNWSADDTSVLWDNSRNHFKTQGYSGTADWQKVTLDFTVNHDVKTIRLNVRLVSCIGTVYVTDFAVEKRGSGGPDVGDPVVANGSFTEEMTLKRNDTPAGSGGDGIRYHWGAWFGSSTDGSPVEQTMDAAFQIVTAGLPEGIGAAMKVNANRGTSYELRQIIEGLDPNMEYVLRAQVKTEAIAGDGVCLKAAFLTAEKEMIWEIDGENVTSKVVTGDNGWADLYVKFTPPAGGRDLYLAGSVMNASGSAYFTDFELLPAVFYEEPGGEGDGGGETTAATAAATTTTAARETAAGTTTAGEAATDGQEPAPATGDHTAAMAFGAAVLTAGTLLMLRKPRRR